ncbi:MAG: hypothetical protein A2Y20_07990 [Firmicutes bacterium GWF2_51_9]|nr:MAG: hypothetical protein A2Y20_07990 [Firmicutes bacterium GWF2_51_9]OGS58649.1 MAG: hypothetical protein A2Y19_03725 [Firmicutes bacterium GWE2_51_13]HAM63649.1 RQC domain protein [Erysipelotrichaceae bacterium]HAO60567.1 RQC domain protein [Erysipelotrichaceae bacterium]HBZ40413.1 RQC domain protein [Erysipelotrichaceae bacterium]
MGKKVRIPFHLNAEGVDTLTDHEIVAILQGADPMIGVGGRNLLAKVLKGSKSKAIIDHELNFCSVYGFYHDKTLEEITHRIDKAIYLGYLKLEYQGKLPVFVFTETGWNIVKSAMVCELYTKITESIRNTDLLFCEQLKGRNREMILLLIDKLKNEADASFVPFLQMWEKIEYKKIRDEIKVVLDTIRERGKIDAT